MTVEERLEKIEAMLAVLVDHQTNVREWYSTHEFAKAVGKAEFTIREYCRLSRLRAEKRQSGRGAYAQWVLSHAELLRYQREGLRRESNHVGRRMRKNQSGRLWFRWR